MRAEPDKGGMAMGTRKQRERQKGLWIATAELPRSAGTPEYLKAAAAARRGVQPEPGSAPGSRSRDAPGPRRPPHQSIFLFLRCLGDPGKPWGKLGSAAGDFCRPISDPPASGSVPERVLKNTISTTDC